MKKLLLIRHAKSTWDVSIPNDFDRPLSERGQRDAPDMAKRLLKRGVLMDAFVTSPAKRAYQTAAYFLAAYNVKEKHLILVPELYEAGVETFFKVTEALNNELKTVALFSHNPGITEFASLLTTLEIDNLPTCAIFAIKCDIKKWKDFRAAKKEYWFFDYPKLQ